MKMLAVTFSFLMVFLIGSARAEEEQTPVNEYFFKLGDKDLIFSTSTKEFPPKILEFGLPVYTDFVQVADGSIFVILSTLPDGEISKSEVGNTWVGIYNGYRFHFLDWIKGLACNNNLKKAGLAAYPIQSIQDSSFLGVYIFVGDNHFFVEYKKRGFTLSKIEEGASQLRIELKDGEGKKSEKPTFLNIRNRVFTEK